MKQTTNLKLKKPDSTDPVLISDINGNMDVLDQAITNKLDKKGAVVDYAVDPKQMQLRNIISLDSAPSANIGKNGDIAITPGAGGEDQVTKGDLDKKLDKSGGTMTGNLTVGSSKIQTNGYIIGTWLQTTGSSKISVVPDQIAVLSDGWVYYVTKAQLKEALGVNDKQDKITYSNSAPSPSVGQNGDIWIVTE